MTLTLVPHRHRNVRLTTHETHCHEGGVEEEGEEVATLLVCKDRKQFKMAAAKVDAF